MSNRHIRYTIYKQMIDLEKERKLPVTTRDLLWHMMDDEIPRSRIIKMLDYMFKIKMLAKVITVGQDDAYQFN